MNIDRTNYNKNSSSSNNNNSNSNKKLENEKELTSIESTLASINALNLYIDNLNQDYSTIESNYHKYKILIELDTKDINNKIEKLNNNM